MVAKWDRRETVEDFKYLLLQVQVRSLRNAEVAYALAVGSETILLSFPPHEEFSILIVEPCGFNGGLAAY